MGHSGYSDATYTSRLADHAAKGTSFFLHDTNIRAGKVKAAAHKLLDPAAKNAAGLVIRESRDSDEHPLSRAVAVLFDVTGSMGKVPDMFKNKLGQLMAMLIKKGYLMHPQVLFGAIGDATSGDRAPLQVGQFESGNEMDDALANIYIEKGGGGQTTESYELAMYFMARHTDMDCFNKRGEKGYLFISGDETPYPKVVRSQVEAIIGDTIQEDIPLETILAELRQKFEVFWICPKQGSYFNNDAVMDRLRSLFGQNMLVLEDANDVCELIATTIGVAEGYDIHEVSAALKDIGADAGSVARAGTAVVAYAASTALRRTAKADGDLVPAGPDSVARL